MPHKHTRKGETKDSIDLPPSQIAKPLPVSKSANSNSIFTSEIDASSSKKKANTSKRKRKANDADDTPKAFQRLMLFASGKKLPKGLDDGSRPAKKAKKSAAGNGSSKNDAGSGSAIDPVPSNQQPSISQSTELPTIRPGEKMSDFSARVDATLPLSGLMNKTGRGGKDPLGLKQYRTKKEKKMHKMYDEWREQDAKIKEKRLEAMELAEENADEEDDVWVDDDAQDTTKKSKKAKRKKMLGEVDDDKNDDDPWAVLKKNRNEAKVGLHDVALAPPELKAPKAKFKVRGGAMVEVSDVPAAAGSLRRREELGAERASIIESYRRLMKEKAGGKDS